MPPLLKAAEIDLEYGITQTPTAEGVPLGTAVIAGGNLFLLPTNAPIPRRRSNSFSTWGRASPS